MRRIEEADIFELRKDGKVKSKDGKDIMPDRLSPQNETLDLKLTELELQTKAIKTLSAMIATMLNAQSKSSTMLVDAMVKAKTPSLPDFPKPVKNWSFDVTRNEQGFIESIHAKAV